MPRISVPVDPKLFRRMQRLFPWGTQAAAVRQVMTLLCDKVENEGLGVIELLISGRYNPVDSTIQERVRIKG